MLGAQLHSATGMLVVRLSKVSRRALRSSESDKRCSSNATCDSPCAIRTHHHVSGGGGARPGRDAMRVGRASEARGTRGRCDTRGIRAALVTREHEGVGLGRQQAKRAVSGRESETGDGERYGEGALPSVPRCQAAPPPAQACQRAPRRRHCSVRHRRPQQSAHCWPPEAAARYRPSAAALPAWVEAAALLQAATGAPPRLRRGAWRWRHWRWRGRGAGRRRCCWWCPRSDQSWYARPALRREIRGRWRRQQALLSRYGPPPSMCHWQTHAHAVQPPLPLRERVRAVVVCPHTLAVGAARGEELATGGEGARGDGTLVAMQSVEEAPLHQVPDLPADRCHS